MKINNTHTKSLQGRIDKLSSHQNEAHKLKNNSLLKQLLGLATDYLKHSDGGGATNIAHFLMGRISHERLPQSFKNLCKMNGLKLDTYNDSGVKNTVDELLRTSRYFIAEDSQKTIAKLEVLNSYLKSGSDIEPSSSFMTSSQHTGKTKSDETGLDDQAQKLSNDFSEAEVSDLAEAVNKFISEPISKKNISAITDIKFDYTDDKEVRKFFAERKDRFEKVTSPNQLKVKTIGYDKYIAINGMDDEMVKSIGLSGRDSSFELRGNNLIKKFTEYCAKYANESPNLYKFFIEHRPQDITQDEIIQFITDNSVKGYTSSIMMLFDENALPADELNNMVSRYLFMRMVGSIDLPW